MAGLLARDRIILAVDVSVEEDAERLVAIARQAGARFVKFGLEMSSAFSWRYCAKLAASNGLDWIADAKLDDIPRTVAAAVANIRRLDHPPFGITMHTTSGAEAMRLAQHEAGDIKMLGVTVLTSIGGTASESDGLSEGERLFHVPVRQEVMELAREAVRAGMAGVVCSPLEVGMVKADPETRGLFAMIPGSRSAHVDAGDQARVGTPATAIREGADLLVIGRQITQSEDPLRAYEDLVSEIEDAL
ncbi:MAG: orotidine-5'-phosphate decarboxylase [Acidimicrobiales bacterium]|jgi:orotidine-5'-phosphate decarboxylase